MLKLKEDDAKEVESPPVSFLERNEMADSFEEFEDAYVSSELKPYVTKDTEDFVRNDKVKSSGNIVEESKKDNPIASAAVLIGFIAWIGGLVCFSKTEPKLCLSLFGAFWLVIAVASLVGVIKKGIHDARNFIVAFIFTYLGICLTFVPVLQLKVPSFQGETGFRIAMHLVFIFCIGLGTMFICIETYRLIRNRVMCTVEVSAECLKLKDEHFWRDEVKVQEITGYWHRRKSVSGIYRFEYEGKTYEVQDDTNSNLQRPMPGEIHTLHINPKNPNQFYRSTPLITIGMYVIGVSFLLIGIVCCIVF